MENPNCGKCAYGHCKGTFSKCKPYAFRKENSENECHNFEDKKRKLTEKT